LEPYSNPADAETTSLIAPGLSAHTTEETNANQSITDDPLRSASLDIIRATRTWVQYGVVGFAFLCILIGAVEALFGK